MGRPRQARQVKKKKSETGDVPPESSSYSPPPEGGNTAVSSYAGRGRKSSSLASRSPSPPPTPRPRVFPPMRMIMSSTGPVVDPEDANRRCDFCLFPAESNQHGQPEALLVCKECDGKAHPSCMKYSPQLAQRALNSPWQCNDCKTCHVCDDSGDPVSDDAMLFCDACDKGYHMDCHNPPVEEKPTGSWVCGKCVLEQQGSHPMDLDLDREISRDSISTSTEGPASLPTPSASPVPTQEGAPDQNQNTVKQSKQRRLLSPVPMMNGHVNPPLPRLSDTLPINVPDASDWSIQDVADYFIGVGFSEQAEVFKDQEIDGKSLLLMKRSDVLTGLSIKLGPALKIYTHIQRLQTMGHTGYI